MADVRLAQVSVEVLRQDQADVHVAQICIEVLSDGIPSATVTQTASATDGTNATTYNFNAQAVGSDGGDDVIYISVGSRTVSGTPTSVTCTVDGVSADLIVEKDFDEGGSIHSVAALFAIDRNDLPDPSQTDVDVAVTFAVSMLRCGCAVSVSGDAVKTATATATQEQGTGDLNLNTPAHGIVLGVIFQGETGTFTWSGLTEQTDTEIESGSFSTALASNVTAETPRSVDVSTSSSDLSASVAASFAAAAAGGQTESPAAAMIGL